MARAVRKNAVLRKARLKFQQPLAAAGRPSARNYETLSKTRYNSVRISNFGLKFLQYILNTETDIGPHTSVWINSPGILSRFSAFLTNLSRCDLPSWQGSQKNSLVPHSSTPVTIESLENRVYRTFPLIIGSRHERYKPIKIDATRRE